MIHIEQNQQSTFMVQHVTNKGVALKPAKVIAQRYKGNVLQYKIKWTQYKWAERWVDARTCVAVEVLQPQAPTLWQRFIALFGIKSK